MNVRFARFLAKKDFCHFGFDLLGIILQRAHEERVLDEGKNTLCKQRIAVIELFFVAPEVLAVASQAEESKLLASSKPLLIQRAELFADGGTEFPCWMLLNIRLVGREHSG